MVGVIVTYSELWWVFRDNDIGSHKFYAFLSLAWIVTFPLFVIITSIAYCMIVYNERKGFED